MTEHYVVFDFLEVVSIDIENEQQDFAAEITESWATYIYPNFFAKIPVEIIKKKPFEIDDILNNLRVIIKSPLSSDDLANTYNVLIHSFFNEPDEYKLGQQFFQFAELKSVHNLNGILNNNNTIENIEVGLLKVYNASDF